MEWLKTIIAEHVKELEGVNVDDIIASVNAEAPKHIVPKDKYNNIAEQRRNAEKALKDLQDANKGNEDLQATIQQLQADNESLKSEMATKERTSLLKEKLEGAKDIDYMIYKLGELETDEDGNIKDLDEKIKALRAENAEFFEATPEPPATGNGGEPEPAPGANGWKPIDNGLPPAPAGSLTPEQQASAEFNKALGLA